LFYRDCVSIYNDVQKSLQTTDKDNKNEIYNPQFASYFLNNWTGLSPMWSNLHLGDQIKHGKTAPYVEWSAKYSHYDCVITPPRTQGFLELHQKLTKNIAMSSKMQRADIVITELKSRKFSSHRINQVQSSKKGKVKLATENYKKSRKRSFTYQSSPNFNKFRKLEKDIIKEECENVSPIANDRKTKAAPSSTTTPSTKMTNQPKNESKSTRTPIVKKPKVKANKKATILCQVCKTKDTKKNILSCNLCSNNYHPACIHPTSVFTDEFPTDTYICKHCIKSTYTSLASFISKKTYSTQKFDKESIESFIDTWSHFDSETKLFYENLVYPLPLHYSNLPKQQESNFSLNKGIKNEYNNCFMSVVLHSLLGTSVIKFIPSQSECPTAVVKSIHACRKELQRENSRKPIDLKEHLNVLSTKVLNTDLMKKIQHDCLEFMEKLIDGFLEDSIFAAENFESKLLNFLQCLSCKKISATVSNQPASISIVVPEKSKAVSLESLLYANKFCNLEDANTRTKCTCEATAKVHEASFYLQPPKVLMVYTNRSVDNHHFCTTPVETPACLHLDGFMSENRESLTYSLVSNIYRFGKSTTIGHFNCALFKYDGTCITYDDISVSMLESEKVLLDLNKQKHSHVSIYVMDKSNKQQHYPTSEHLPWSFKMGNHKVIESYRKEIENQSVNISDLNSVVLDRKLNDTIIDEFMTSLNENGKFCSVKSITTLLMSNLNKTEIYDKDLFKFVFLDKQLFEKDQILIPLNITSSHWILLSLMPKFHLAVYLDPLLSTSDPFTNIEPVFKFLNMYSSYHGLENLTWKVLVHDLLQQQSNATDCGAFCCVNAYNLVHQARHVVDQNEMSSIRIWIASTVADQKLDQPQRNKPIYNKDVFDKVKKMYNKANFRLIQISRNCKNLVKKEDNWSMLFDVIKAFKRKATKDKDIEVIPNTKELIDIHQEYQDKSKINQKCKKKSLDEVVKQLNQEPKTDRQLRKNRSKKRYSNFLQTTNELDAALLGDNETIGITSHHTSMEDDIPIKEDGTMSGHGLDTSSTESDDSDSSYSGGEINTSFMQYVEQQKEFVLKLVNNETDIYSYSERLQALTRSTSRRKYKDNALDEEQMLLFNKEFGTDFFKYESYIVKNFLMVSKIRDDMDIFSFGGTELIDFKIKQVWSVPKTVHYVILPELFTKYIMEKHNIGYRDASCYLYGNILPTFHHVQYLLEDKEVITSTKVTNSKSECVVVQVIQGDITRETTHAIVNAANKLLRHDGGVAKAIRQAGGKTIQEESSRYIDQHGELDIGEAVLAKPGDLNCFHLIHAVGPEWERDSNESELLHNAVVNAIQLADTNQCKSISIPAIICGIFGRKAKIKTATAVIKKSIFDSIMAGTYNYIKVVRLILKDETIIFNFKNIDKEYLKLSKAK